MELEEKNRMNKGKLLANGEKFDFKPSQKNEKYGNDKNRDNLALPLPGFLSPDDGNLVILKKLLVGRVNFFGV